MHKNSSGAYPIETRSGEIERLRVQGEAMSPGTQVMLDLIGVGKGWHCIDIGCGPRGITDELSFRVGDSGRVIGLDMNDVFLEYGRAHAPSNVEFLRGDAYESDLPAASFDLVHMRFVASTAGDPDRLIAEAKRLAKPGGIIALQEPDGSTLNCYPPHRAWEKLKMALLGAFSGVGADLTLAHKLYGHFRGAGLQDVNYRPFIIGVRSQDPMVDYLPSTVESLRGTIMKLDLLSDAEFETLLEECRAHLNDPGTVFTMYTVAQVWGRRTD